MNAPMLIAVALIERPAPDTGTPSFLVARRRADAHLGGSWELPGGKVEDEESPSEALARELTEELGLRLCDTELTPLTFSHHRYPAREVLILFFHLHWTPAHGEPAPLASEGLQWLAREGLLDCPMPPANAPLLDVVARGALPRRDPADAPPKEPR